MTGAPRRDARTGSTVREAFLWGGGRLREAAECAVFIDTIHLAYKELCGPSSQPRLDIQG